MRVLKYQITPDDYFELDLPFGAEILSVQSQFEIPCIWVLCDSTLPYEIRKFRMAGTGHLINEDPSQLIFIGTFQLGNGSLVFHVFEIK